MSGKKVLIIDDEIDLCILLKNFLTRQHFEVVVSHKLSEGLQEALNFSPDIIFLDINMPMIDGFQFLEEFDKLADDVKKFYRIFILTSSQNANDISRAKANTYVSEVLIKPLTKETLVDLLKTVAPL